MGKQMSKVGARRNVHRRQRSQQASQPTVIASPEPPHFAPETTDRAILTLKLQRDELTVYKGHVQALLRKEDDVIRRLLKQGKSDRAKLLLKKKLFQEHLIQQTEKALSFSINQAGEQSKLPAAAVRQEVDQLIDRNAEAIKRLHMLLSLENVEKLAEETGEGSQKQSEVYRLLALATQAEGEFLDVDTDADFHKLVDSLGLRGGGSRVTPIPEEEAVASGIDPKEDSDTEMLVMQKKVEKGRYNFENVPGTGHHVDVAHQGDLVVDTSEDETTSAIEARGGTIEKELSNDQGNHQSAYVNLNTDAAADRIEDAVSIAQSIASSISEMTTAEVDADDEKSSGGPSETQSQEPLNPPADISSSLLPDLHTRITNEAVSEVAAEENKQNVQA